MLIDFRLIPSLLVVLCFGLTSSAQQTVPVPGSVSSLAILHVTVIDLFGGPPKMDQTVIVRGGQIVRMGNSGHIAVPSGAERIEAHGKYLLPGFWDAHVHLENSGDYALTLLIANGVTGVRDMAGDLKTVRDWRRQIVAGERIGPRIQVSGPALESASFLDMLPKVDEMFGLHLSSEILPTRIGIRNPEDARNAVDRLVEMGADFVKFRTIASREIFLAISDESKKRGISLAGHEPDAVSLAEASSRGLQSIEHLPFLSLGKISDAARMATFETFARKGTRIDPTLVATLAYRGTPDAEILKIITDKSNSIDTRRRYVSPKLLEFWRAQMVVKQIESPMDWSALINQGYQDLRAMRKAGVHFLAGTDVGAPLIYPGFSLHNELALLVEQGGLTATEALRTAIIEPVLLLGLQRQFGTVEPGKVADLLILDGDPTEDIHNTERIFAVIVGGRLFAREELDTMLAGVARSIAEDNGSRQLFGRKSD